MHTQGPEEPAAWSQELCDLYREHFEKLVKQARAVVQSHHLAEEATQDAFVKFQLCITEVDPQRQASYLRSIVLNNAVSIVRREQVRKKHAHVAWTMAASPEAQVVLSDEACRLHRAINQLPSRQQEVIRLRYLAEYSEAKTANELGISTGSIKTHASRGRNSLHRMLVS